jgi:hypothetical protein
MVFTNGLVRGLSIEDCMLPIGVTVPVAIIGLMSEVSRLTKGPLKITRLGLFDAAIQVIMLSPLPSYVEIYHRTLYY